MILLLRLTFTIPNRRRDKKFAEGNAEYDPSTVTYEDQSDLKNMHFRYLCEYPSAYPRSTKVWPSADKCSLSINSGDWLDAWSRDDH